jgi:hypothetical protein
MNAFANRFGSAVLFVVAGLIGSQASAQPASCAEFAGQSVSVAGEVFNVTKDDESGRVVYFVNGNPLSGTFPCRVDTFVVTGTGPTERCKLGQTFSGTGTIRGDAAIPSTVLIQATKYSCR